MKTELRATPHKELAGHTTIEMWHNGKFIGTIVGADQAGVRIIARANFEVIDMKATLDAIAGQVVLDCPNVLEVHLLP